MLSNGQERNIISIYKSDGPSFISRFFGANKYCIEPSVLMCYFVLMKLNVRDDKLAEFNPNSGSIEIRLIFLLQQRRRHVTV